MVCREFCQCGLKGKHYKREMHVICMIRVPYANRIKYISVVDQWRTQGAIWGIDEPTNDLFRTFCHYNVFVM